ncbi:aminoacyltransferase [Holdemanella sp. SCCA2]|nr:aminoacyltransferase [Holdemanella sp. SCCA2]
MDIKEIKPEVFSEYAKNHILKNFFQTKEYGDLMKHSDFSVMYVGAYHKGLIVGASLILYKSIGPNMKYGYAPRGFLVDFYDEALLKMFTKKIKEYFLMKGFAFIKINPEVTYSVVNFDDKSKLVNSKSKDLVLRLKELGYDKLRDNLYFESLLPKYTPVINLPNYDFSVLDEKLINNMKDAEISGISMSIGNEDDIEKFYSFVNDKESKTSTYYKFFYKEFKKSDMVDLLMVNLNYETYVKYLQKQYIVEQETNDALNRQFEMTPNDAALYAKKTRSDDIMNRISADMALANQRMQENNPKEVLGAAFVVKYEGRVTIIISGYNKDFQGIDVKSYIFYKIIEEYKKAGYLYLDLYGITADFTDSNPYKALNDFKLKFKPTVYEYIGEFDLIVNKPFHQLLWSTNQIQKEFYKPAIKRTGAN